MTTSIVAPGKRIDELDGLRGIAAICVVLYHYTHRFGEKFENDIITQHFDFKYGSYGVELFFIISGFVIFMSIEKVKTPFEFVYKRFIRLYPTFWICMTLTFIFVHLFGPMVLKVNSMELLVNITMLPSLFDVKSVDGVYWTLKVEMFFYAFVLLLISFRQTHQVRIIGYIFIIAGFALLILMGKVPQYYYFGTLFLIGINFYQIWKNNATWSNHLQILLCLILAYDPNNKTVVIITLILISVFYCMVFGFMKFLQFPVLIFLGKISYALYLIHQNIGHSIQLQMIDHGIRNFWILTGLPLIVALLLSYAITFWFEKPMMSKLIFYYKLKFN